MNNIPLLEFKHVSKRFGSFYALSDCSFTIPSGRIVGVLGPNGSGKTTLLKLINGLLVPNEGEILLNGQAPGIASKADVSYLPDRIYFDEAMRGSELIRMYEDFYEDFDTTKALDLISRLNIDPEKKIKTLSKGNKEKLQLSMVMSRKAKLYVLDEPIGGVDPAAREYILNTIISNYNPEGSILITTHLINDVEPILDDCIFFKDGRPVLYDSVDNIRAEKGESLDALFREVFRC